MKRTAPFTLKWSIGIVGSFFLSGSVLFLAELLTTGKNNAFQQLPFVVILCIVFSGMVVISLRVLLHLGQKHEKQLLNFYLLKKFFRFMVAVVALVIYAFCRMENLLLFTLNLLVFYFLEMGFSIFICNRVERCLKTK